MEQCVGLPESREFPCPESYLVEQVLQAGVEREEGTSQWQYKSRSITAPGRAWSRAMAARGKPCSSADVGMQ
jgi:hypothetical protein